MRRLTLRRVLAALAACLWVLAGDAFAHESRPLYVQIVEQDPEIYALTWKVPASISAFNHPTVLMPARCTALNAAVAPSRDLVYGRLFGCEGGLDGAAIEIRFPVFNPSVTTLIRLQRLSGEARSAVLGPDQTRWIVPVGESSLGVARIYLGLGIEHILKGADHLLFVACLLFIAGTWRRILITITGFTVAHSVTLGLSALGLVRVPVPPVEAAVALSIVFLATEIARGRRDTLTWRIPIAVAASFGLLHGFGFATVLGEVGLPQTEIPAALLFFNLGVEVGQLLFVGALSAGFLALRRVLSAVGVGQAVASRHMDLQRAVAYGVGTLSAFWVVQRTVSFWA